MYRSFPLNNLKNGKSSKVVSSNWRSRRSRHRSRRRRRSSRRSGSRSSRSSSYYWYYTTVVLVLSECFPGLGFPCSAITTGEVGLGLSESLGRGFRDTDFG